MTDWSKYKAPEKTDKWSAYKAVASELKKKENSDSTSEVPASESNGFRPAKTDFQVEPTIENFTVETEKREPTSLDYIANTSGSVIKSLIDFGGALQSQLDFHSPNPIKDAIDQVQSQSASTRDWLKGYDANKAEDVAAFALGLVMDAPLFGAGGKIGKAASKPLINALKLLKNNAVKEGVEAFSAKQFTQNLAKKYAASVISNTASSATALGAYDSMVDFKNQIESGRDLEDIDWSENLKGTAKGTLMGAALGPLAPSFGLASRYVNNTMSKGIAKSMANIGIKASEIPVEASVFSVLGKEKDQPLSWETYLDNVLMVGVMKGTGAIQKLRDLSKDQGSIYGVGLKPEESAIFKERGIESMESLDMQPAKIEELLQDKHVPLITKSKLLWRFAGVRADKLDMSPVNATISKDGEKSIVKVWNKDKELVDLQSYDNAEQAEGDALNVLRQADDLKLWQEASELTLQQKKRVTDKLGDLQEINQISLIPVSERTSADQKKVMSFRNAIEAIKKEDLEEAKSDVQSGGKTKSDTKLSPEKDNLSLSIKNALQETLKSQQENLNLQNKIQENEKLDNQNSAGDKGGQVGGFEPRGTNDATNTPKQPRYDAGGSRRLTGYAAVKEYSLSETDANNILAVNPKAVIDKSFHQTDNAEAFHSAISRSKEGNKYSASVFVYPVKDYKKSKKFLTDDGLAGTAVTEDGTIVSVFSHGEGKGRTPQLILQAIKEGGVKLDHYDTYLSDYYHDFGFVPVARVKWNDKYAPEDWNKETFKKYNNGEPDVVLMAYQGGDPNTLSSRYKKFGSVRDALDKAPYYKSFEEAQKAQDQYIKDHAIQIEKANEVGFRQQETLGEGMGAGNTQREIPAGESKQAEAPQETLQETVGSLLEKETPKSSESGFMPFIAPLNIFDNPRAKRKAKDVVQILREQFLPSRGMPKEVHKEFMKTVGRINAKRYDIERSLKESKDELLKAYGDRLTDVQKEDIQKALENIGVSKTSSNIAFNTIASNVPVEARGVVEKMRNMIDSYSDDLKKLDMIGAGLEGKIDENTGYYVTRSYKKHTDRDWTWENIPLKIKEDAANKLIDIFKITPDEALGMAKEMLETPDLTDYVIRKGNSIADIDKRSLQKRSQFLTDNVEIRALLGENRDPLYNYAVSLMRISEMAERGKMIEDIRDIMLQNGLLSEAQSYEKNHIAQVKYNQGLYKGKTGTKQLSDYYTTPEIAHAMNSFMDTGTPMGKAMKFYMKAITYTKISKTAGSIKGLVRNFKSNIFNAVGNGNWNIPQIGMYFNEVRKTKDNRVAFIRELKENNIIGDSSNAGELMRNVEDITNSMSKISSSDESLGEKVHRNVVGGLLKAYGAMDDVWKIYRYVSEKVRYKDAYVKNGMTEPEAEMKARESASEILHKTSTYYSQLPQFIQNMRKLPFTNTFVSFPYLTTVNYLNTLQTSLKEIGTPGLAHIGTQRLAGAITGFVALAAISQFKNASNGIDDKELESYRRFLPKFWRNDDITIAEVKDNGVAEYNNSSYMDYYGVLTTPTMILRRRYRANGTITDEDLMDAAKEFGSNLIGWDILFNSLTEVKANQDDLGRQIYNPQDDWSNKYRDMTNYILKNSFEPGTMTDAKRIYKTYREGGDWKRQMTGTLSGSQSRTLEPLKSLDFYMLPQYKDQIDNARKIYRTELKNFQRLTAPTEADQAKLAQAKERSESIMNSILGEITQDYDAAIRVGVKQEDLDKVVRGEKFDKDITNAILYRRGIGLDDLGAIVLQNQE